jgi:phosphoesterase RecJ-like protein
MPTPETEEDIPLLVQGEESARARAIAAVVLGRAKSVILSSHEKVDADGAGSALGLAAGLRALGRKAVVALPSPLPDNLLFLPGAADCVVVERGSAVPQELRNHDAFVSLDSGAASRLGALRALAEECPVLLNVDHHASNEGFGTHRWVDDTYAAVGTMAFELLCGPPPASRGASDRKSSPRRSTGRAAWSPGSSPPRPWPPCARPAKAASPGWSSAGT